MINFQDKLLQHESAEKYNKHGAKVGNFTTVKKLASDIFVNLRAHFSLLMLSKAPGGENLQATSYHNSLVDDFLELKLKWLGYLDLELEPIQ